MEVLLNGNVIGIIPKSSDFITLNKIESNDSSKLSFNNVISVNNKKYNINWIVDSLQYFKDNLNNDEYKFNCDMYEEIPFKYSIVKKNGDIYLYSVKIS